MEGVVEGQQHKNWKEKLISLPLVGWFFQILFRVFGVRTTDSAKP